MYYSHVCYMKRVSWFAQDGELVEVWRIKDPPPPEYGIHRQPRKRTVWWKREWNYSYILSRASSLFYVLPELESLLLRACQMIVAVGVDENSLQRRLFKFTGCRGRPTIDIPKEILELYLKHHFTPVQIAQLFCVSTKTIRRRLNEFQLHVEKHSCLTVAELDDDM